MKFAGLLLLLVGYLLEHFLEDSWLEDPLLPLLGCFQDLQLEDSFLEELQEGSCLEGHLQDSFQVDLQVLQVGSYPGGEVLLEDSFLENHSVGSWRTDLLEDSFQEEDLQKDSFQEEVPLKDSFQVDGREDDILHILLQGILGCTGVGGSLPELPGSCHLEGILQGIQGEGSHGGSRIEGDSLLQEVLLKVGSYLQACLGSLPQGKPQLKGKKALQGLEDFSVAGGRRCRWFAGVGWWWGLCWRWRWDHLHQGWWEMNSSLWD